MLALLLALFVTGKSVAQTGIVVVEGQQKNLGVIPNAGDTYVWRIYTKPTFQTADLASQSDVEYSMSSTQRGFAGTVEEAGRLFLHSYSFQYWWL